MKRKISLFKLTLAFALGLMVAGPAGAAATVALSFIPSGAYHGTMRAGLIPEVWTGEMVKAFRYDDTATFMEGVPDYSRFVQQGDIIHMIDFGLSPDVLVNNTTYPIPIQDLENEDIVLKLDKYQTKVSRITDDELHDEKGDYVAAAIESHRVKISQDKYDKAIHSIAPAKNVAGKTPVLKTTGRVLADDGTVAILKDGNRLRLTRLDIIDLKKEFDKMKAPAQGRRLVLSPEHVSDLLTIDQKFSEQFYNYRTGKISNLYGFDVYEYVNTPYYTAAGNKKAFKASVETTDRQASVAFILSLTAKAVGSTNYYIAEASSNPQTQANLLNFRHYYMAMPKKELGQAAIVSADAAAE